MSTKKNSPKFDPYNSTYRHRILFADGVKELIGYSNKQGWIEREDKIIVLINYILRLYKAGYLDRYNYTKDKIECIEFYANDDSNTRIFTLFYSYCEWEPSMIGRKDFGRLITFIERFYEMVEKNTSPSKIYETLYYRGRRKRTAPLDLEIHRFQNEADLMRHCQSVVERELAEPSEVEAFFRKYRDKYLTGSKSTNQMIPGTENLLEKFTKEI